MGHHQPVVHPQAGDWAARRVPKYPLGGRPVGFGEPTESPHDTLCAATPAQGFRSLSASRKEAANRRLDSWTIAIVGDGAMTSGSSFEALNNIAHLNPEKFIVVLNDNGMSISENIGFLTNWRKHLITHPEFNAMIGRMKALSKKVPTGELMYRLVKRFNTGLAGLIVPTMFWTEMGFQYLGPIDGHDFKQLEQTLQQAQDPHRLGASGPRRDSQGPRVRACRRRPGEVSPAKLSARGRLRCAYVLEGLRTDSSPPHARRRVRGRYKRCDAGGHGPCGRAARLPR